MVEFLAQEGIASVCVTLYGMDAAVHDAVTSHPGSFAKTRAGIENLQKAKVRTEIKTPVLKQNFHQIGALAQWSSDKGISFRPDALITPKNSGCDAPLAQSPTAEEIRIALSTFPEEREIAEGIETLHCNAGFNYGAITTEGKILPCIQFPHEIGSIEKDDFSEVWKNASFLQKLRTTTNDDLTKCLECGYLKYCDRCPGLAYIATGTHCGIAPVCCELAKIRANN
jgi:radical SAM protein with 4Fe4S-binding SPASM domain